MNARCESCKWGVKITGKNAHGYKCIWTHIVLSRWPKQWPSAYRRFSINTETFCPPSKPEPLSPVLHGGVDCEVFEPRE